MASSLKGYGKIAKGKEGAPVSHLENNVAKVCRLCFIFFCFSGPWDDNMNLKTLDYTVGVDMHGLIVCALRMFLMHRDTHLRFLFHFVIGTVRP
jgi:hypothetical protein